MAFYDHTELADTTRPRPLSVDVRAQMVVDSIGVIGDGDYRKRVFDAAAQQIRAALAQAGVGLPD